MKALSRDQINDQAIPVALEGDKQLIWYHPEVLTPSVFQSETGLTPWCFADTLTYVSGRRGCGKSTYASIYANNYAKYTGNKVVYISKFEDDPSIDLPERHLIIPVSEVGELEGSDFQNTLIIFDDIHDNRLTKTETKMLNQFIIDEMENSRHYLTQLIITSHMICDYQKTRAILNEMSSLVIYPEYSNHHQILYALGKYADMTEKQVDQIISNTDRWVQIQTIKPKFVLSTHQIYTYK